METQHAKKEESLQQPKQLWWRTFHSITAGFSGCCVKITTPPIPKRICWKVAHSSPPKWPSIAYFACFAKEKERKSDLRLPLDVLYSPSWEWRGKMSRESDWVWAGEAGRRAGASSVAVRQSPSDLNQKLRSLSSSLGRYHELRRDRGRWVGYVRKAGGINGANLQRRCRGSKRGQPPGELKERRVTVWRRRRHCLREIYSGRTSGNDLSFLLSSTTLENLVCSGVT